MLTSLVILLGNILIVYRISEALLPEAKYGPLLSAIVTAFYFPLVFWSLRGMEIGLLVLLINAALLLAVKNESPILLSLVLMLAIIVRIDAAISAMLIALYVLVKRKSFLPILAVLFTVAAI